MNYAQLFTHYEQELALLGEEPEALKFVFCQLKGFSLTDLVLSLRHEVSPSDAQCLKVIFQELSQHRPAQYILGYADFCGLRLEVDERVLIPRPETEELVERVLADRGQDQLRVLDLCTGSGAIALALKKDRPSWQIVASDLSALALEVAEANAERLGLSLELVESSLFERLTGPFDLIVSNPPYISWEDQEEVGVNVLTWEPHLALFAEEEGLAIYRQIATEASAFLTEKGSIYLEIGYKQGEAVKALFEEAFPQHTVQVYKDHFGQDRMVVVSYAGL